VTQSQPPLGGDSSAQELRENLPRARSHSWAPAVLLPGGSERSPQPQALTCLAETTQFSSVEAWPSRDQLQFPLQVQPVFHIHGTMSPRKRTFFKHSTVCTGENFSEKSEQRLAECTGTSSLEPPCFHRVHLTSPHLCAFLGNTNLLYCLTSCLYRVVELGNPRGSSSPKRRQKPWEHTLLTPSLHGVPGCSYT